MEEKIKTDLFFLLPIILYPQMNTNPRPFDTMALNVSFNCNVKLKFAITQGAK